MWSYKIIVCLAVVSTALGDFLSKVDISAEQDVVISPENYEFYCNSSEAANFSVTINKESDGEQFKRLTNESITDTDATFILGGTEPLDDGSTIACVAKIGDKKYFSAELTIQVEYKPIFHISNTTLVMISTGDDTILLWNVTANPPNVSYVFHTDASDHGDATFEEQGLNGSITFTKAKVHNIGTYNVTASNSIGNTTLSYNVFVGGPPEGANVSCEVVPQDDILEYVCEVYNDDSDAPATGLYLNSTGLEINVTVLFNATKYPVKEEILTLVNTSLFDITPDNYTISVYAFNPLGRVLVHEETVFIGLNLNVTLNADSFQVEEKHLFNFTCENTNDIDAQYFVLINDEETGQRHDRLTPTKSNSTSQSYSFNSTADDNEVDFKCCANVTVHDSNLTSCSDDMQLDVLFAPRYFPVTLTPLNDTSPSLSFPIGSLEANPYENITASWTFPNGSAVKGNTLPTTLVLSRVLVEDGGNYTVKACNSVGCGTGTVLVDVYYPPLMYGNTNGSQWIEIKTNDNYNITCTVKQANPHVTKVYFEYNDTNNVRNTSNASSAVLKIDKATQDNAINYTCYATSPVANSSQVFQTFVGGPPDKVAITKLDGKEKDGKLLLSMAVTDGSDAPARKIIYNIKGTKKNITINISAPIRKEPVTYSLEEIKESDFDSGKITVLFYATNDIGTTFITSKDVTISKPTSAPTTPPKSHSHAGAIAAGILVPLCVIVLVIVGVVAGWYFYKKKIYGGKYVRLNVQGKDIDDAGGYGTTS